VLELASTVRAEINVIANVIGAINLINGIFNNKDK
jgi:hypothetical protein